MSLPSRERGLKRDQAVATVQQINVAPFTGAWIETARAIDLRLTPKVAPFTGAWIETASAIDLRMTPKVAPFTGAWIETGLDLFV